MCGIFGVFIKQGSEYRCGFIDKTLKTIALLSEARGKDSSGLAYVDFKNKQKHVFKGAVSISDLLKSEDIIDFERSENLSALVKQGYPFAAIGHARLVTNGSQLHNINNQPVIKDGIVGIHNGIIVNTDNLWAEEPGLKREFEIDTEIFLSLVRKSLNHGGSLQTSVSSSEEKIIGTISAVMLFEDNNEAVLTTNNGSLYILDNERDFIVFASEGHFLRKLAEKIKLGKYIGEYSIKQLLPESVRIINLLTHEKTELRNNQIVDTPRSRVKDCAKNIIVHEIGGGKQNEVVMDISKIHLNSKAHFESAMLEHNYARINALRRCSMCLLPETFPYIEFNKDGTCNYCLNHKQKNHPKPLSYLEELVERYRRGNGSPDCIVPFSGGRDSTFTLHHVKSVLKMNPIAFTYDWGMVTDLARRNIARVCGKLGVENIIVSADIHRKRKNIKQNILAWLRNPDLGMVPLFMAGDKYFFYYTEQLKKQTGIDLNIWGINNLENTDFKVGFCGVKPDFEKHKIYSLSAVSKLKLFQHISKNVLKNPYYLNASVLDTIGSFASRYMSEKKDYYHMFDYYKWDEKEIEKLIKEEYDWESAVDTKTTWRIGDGTAGFYNYIYYTIAGFSEYDTFRSNQIREGMISREEAILKSEEENIPRYASIKWYTEILGLDFGSTIKRINQVPKMYP
jgi:glucosamine--fructose-6-phosphate aminotransferase (isomerizing)